MVLVHLVFGLVVSVAIASFSNPVTFVVGLVLFFSLGRQFFLASTKVPDALSDYLVRSQLLDVLYTRTFSLCLIAAGIVALSTSVGVFGPLVLLGGQLLAFAIAHYVGIATSPKVEAD